MRLVLARGTRRRDEGDREHTTRGPCVWLGFLRAASEVVTSLGAGWGGLNCDGSDGESEAKTPGTLRSLALSGCPEAHWIMHRPSQSADTEPRFPQFLRLPAQPVTRFRVTPYRAPIGCVGDRVSSSLEARSFDCCRRWISEATRISHPSAPLAARFWVAPVPSSSCCASDARCRLPCALHLPASPATDPRGESRFESFGGAD